MNRPCPDCPYRKKVNCSRKCLRSPKESVSGRIRSGRPVYLKPHHWHKAKPVLLLPRPARPVRLKPHTAKLVSVETVPDARTETDIILELPTVKRPSLLERIATCLLKFLTGSTSLTELPDTSAKKLNGSISTRLESGTPEIPCTNEEAETVKEMTP